MFDLSTMGVREQAMLLVGVLAILVMLRGFYVAWRIRRRQARLIDPLMERDGPETPELPGVSRVVGRRQSNAAAGQLEKARRHAATLGLRDGIADGKSVPILMDTVQFGDGDDETVHKEPPSTMPLPMHPPQVSITTAAGPQEILVMNVMARSGQQFGGEELLEVLMTTGLKFGDMDIFHYHLDIGDEHSPVVFSVANILNPGTFDLDVIETFRTVGLSFFLVIPSPKNDQQAFDDMLHIAGHVKSVFNAELRDDHRNIMTAQTIEHYRQRIRDFELHRLQQAATDAKTAGDK